MFTKAATVCVAVAITIGVVVAFAAVANTIAVTDAITEVILHLFGLHVFRAAFATCLDIFHVDTHTLLLGARPTMTPLSVIAFSLASQGVT
jgi:hypothetical protein